MDMCKKRGNARNISSEPACMWLDMRMADITASTSLTFSLFTYVFSNFRTNGILKTMTRYGDMDKTCFLKMA